MSVHVVVLQKNQFFHAHIRRWRLCVSSPLRKRVHLMYLFVTGTVARFAALNLWLMLLSEVLTFDNTSDMWKISVNFISCCYRWWRRHQIRQKIVRRLRYQSHHLQILQIYEFAEPDQNPDQTVLVRFGFFTLTGSVRFEFYIFFCMSVLVQFGSAKMRVLVRFVRFDSHL